MRHVIVHRSPLQKSNLHINDSSHQIKNCGTATSSQHPPHQHRQQQQQQQIVERTIFLHLFIMIFRLLPAGFWQDTGILQPTSYEKTKKLVSYGLIESLCIARLPFYWSASAV